MTFVAHFRGKVWWYFPIHLAHPDRSHTAAKAREGGAVAKTASGKTTMTFQGGRKVDVVVGWDSAILLVGYIREEALHKGSRCSAERKNLQEQERNAQHPKGRVG